MKFNLSVPKMTIKLMTPETKTLSQVTCMDGLRDVHTV
jgi:hypothetical protein